MPKIPTFTAQGRPTAEAPSVRTGVQVSPTTGVAAALLPATKSVQDYFIKQRDNNEKLEAKKKFYEMKSESDKIIERYKNNSDEFASVNGYNEDFATYKQQELSQIKNKRVKKRLQDLLDIDQSENIYKIKANSFDAFERESKVTYETEQNSLANDYTLSTSIENKQKILNKRINSAVEYENIHQMGKAWLDQTVNKIKGDSELSDIEKAINNKDYSTAMSLLKQSKNIDNDEVEKAALKIQKESLEFNETNFHVNNLVKGYNSLIGVDLKYTDNKTILQQTDNVLFLEAEQKNYGPEETFAFVDNSYSRNGLVSSTYKDLIEIGYNTGSTTTFDSPEDIPPQLIQAVKAAETADKFGRLNVYTNTEQERFYTNIITLKKINGLSDFEAIKQAKEFENNYEVFITKASGKQRGKTLSDIEEKFEDINATNMNEVKSYGEKLYNMYLALGVRDREARKKVVQDLENNITVVDNYAYLKRDIVAFQSIDGIDNIPVYKKFIIKNNISETEDPDDYYLRHNGGGQFEIRRKVDLSTVLDKNNNPMIFYPNDLLKIKNQETEEFKKDILEQQRKTQESRKLVTEQEIYFP